MSMDIPATDDMPQPFRLTGDQLQAARRGVLWRYEHGKLTAAEAYTALAMLGILPVEARGEVAS